MARMDGMRWEGSCLPKVLYGNSFRRWIRCEHYSLFFHVLSGRNCVQWHPWWAPIVLTERLPQITLLLVCIARCFIIRTYIQDKLCSYPCTYHSCFMSVSSKIHYLVPTHQLFGDTLWSLANVILECFDFGFAIPAFPESLNWSKKLSLADVPQSL